MNYQAIHEARRQVWAMTFPSHSGGFNAGTGWTVDGRRADAWIHVRVPAEVPIPSGLVLAGSTGSTSRERLMPFASWDDYLAWAVTNKAPTSFAPAKGTRNDVWHPSEKGVDPCPVTVSSGERWSSYRMCGGRVKTDGKCGIHAAADARRAASEKEWRDKWDRERANDKAAKDWVERLRDDFNIESAPSTSRGMMVSLNPEKLYGQLAEIRSYLDDAFGGDHPWAKR